MAKNWWMASADKFGNPNGPRICITDSVLDTCGEGEFDAFSPEQESAANALTEAEFGVKDGTCCGTYWSA